MYADVILTPEIKYVSETISEVPTKILKEIAVLECDNVNIF